jgi:hypothetical protein
MTCWFPNDTPDECMEQVKRLERRVSDLTVALETIASSSESTATPASWLVAARLIALGVLNKEWMK